MRKLIITSLFFLLSVSFCFGQKSVDLSGTIENYNKQSLYLYQCYQDTLLLADSTSTDAKGEFSFQNFSKVSNFGKDNGMYKVVLQSNQFFYILYDSSPVKIKTLYSFNAFYNIATDSLMVLKSTINKQFYAFQHIQQRLNVANNWLLKMMRLYPLPDPFHKQIVAEYFKRYEEMNKFVQPLEGKQSLSALVAKAYYLPNNPDWKQPDQWRDSIIASHYFDYFNPADSFYLHSNILSEKMDMYLSLRTNKRDNYGQPIHDESLYSSAAISFVNKTLSNTDTYQFCLNYYLKKFYKEHKGNAFLSVYNIYLSTQQDDSGSLQTDKFTWARKKANVLKNAQIGSIAPDFDIEKGKLTMHQLQSDYTLLVFWASWCPHCTEVLPEIKKATDSINFKLQTLNSKLITVAISLDTNKAAWQKYVQDNNLFTWLNTSELKGWNGEVSKQYNVHATPTMFLLDKNKKVIAKPENATQLLEWIDANNAILNTR